MDENEYDKPAWMTSLVELFGKKTGKDLIKSKKAATVSPSAKLGVKVKEYNIGGVDAKKDTDDVQDYRVKRTPRVKKKGKCRLPLKVRTALRVILFFYFIVAGVLALLLGVQASLEEEVVDHDAVPSEEALAAAAAIDNIEPIAMTDLSAPTPAPYEEPPAEPVTAASRWFYQNSLALGQQVLVTEPMVIALKDLVLVFGPGERFLAFLEEFLDC
jgi:hypothetical protein